MARPPRAAALAAVLAAALLAVPEPARAQTPEQGRAADTSAVPDTGAVPDTATTRRRAPQRLDTVRTTARRDPTGFAERRRRSAGGYFITGEQIERQKIRRTTDVLLTIPGLVMRRYTYSDLVDARVDTAGAFASGLFDPQYGEQYVLEFRRRPPPSMGGTQGRPVCPVQFYLDGAPYEPTPSQLDVDLAAQSIAAVEAYPAASTVPAQFAGPRAACGVVLLWTREGLADVPPAPRVASRVGVMLGAGRMRLGTHGLLALEVTPRRWPVALHLGGLAGLVSRDRGPDALGEPGEGGSGASQERTYGVAAVTAGVVLPLFREARVSPYALGGVGLSFGEGLGAAAVHPAVGGGVRVRVGPVRVFTEARSQRRLGAPVSFGVTF
jgi:hypothetical protein